MSTSTRTPVAASEPPWRAGVRAMRANLVPGLVLWCVGFAVVVAYYRHAPTRAALEGLIGLRARIGVLFPVLATALCGGALPILVLRRNPDTRDDYRLKNCALLASFWAYKGFEVEMWYRVLARVVGADHGVRTVAIKCFLDQAVYSPFFAVPVTVFVFAFNHAGLRFAPVADDFRAGGWYRRRVLPSLIANAVLWVPMVCLVYALPLPLQTVLFDLALCFCILLVAHITRRPR